VHKRCLGTVKESYFNTLEYAPGVNWAKLTGNMLPIAGYFLYCNNRNNQALSS
jgi:hypothetical protein